MDKRVYLLTTIAFIVGMVELIIGGILDLIANDLNVSIGQAGLLITVFAFAFGLSGPVLLFFIGEVDRKKVTIVTLCVFFIGNIIAIFSHTYYLLLISRVISAASGALLTVLCLTLASHITKPEYRGRAIGLVVMGISGSIVLGLPIGVSMGHAFGWRSPFILIAILTILLTIGVMMFFGNVQTERPVPLKQQIKALQDKKILAAHFTTFFFLAGHFVLYGYLTPYVVFQMNFDGTLITILYFIYGIAAVSGGGLAGFSADKIGTKLTLITAIFLLILCQIIIPFIPVWLFWLILFVWGVLSWSITPPVQIHLVHLAPKTAAIQQSINNSVLHLGIATGTLVGSFVVDTFSIAINPFVGASILLIALGAAFITFQSGREKLSRTLS